MLKMTGAKLEKIFDIDMYIFTEKELRGGIFYIAKKYSKTNSKYMKNYDRKKPSKFITYLDMNNIYGWSVSDYLPYGEFKWLKNVQYPDELHVFHHDHPLAPKKLAIPYDMLLDYCKKIAVKYEMKLGHVKQLIPNSGNKTNYVLHYRNLQLYLSLGMKLTKIHRVPIFKQSEWIKKTKILTLKKEQTLLIVLRKIFFKLTINSVFGKIMENLRLVNNEKDFLNTAADQLILLIKSLIKIMLLLMK